MSGEYSNVDEIFKKVFNEEELNTIYNHYSDEIKEIKDENIEKNNNEENSGGFFTTQQQS